MAGDGRGPRAEEGRKEGCRRKAILQVVLRVFCRPGNGGQRGGGESESRAQRIDNKEVTMEIQYDQLSDADEAMAVCLARGTTGRKSAEICNFGLSPTEGRRASRARRYPREKAVKTCKGGVRTGNT